MTTRDTVLTTTADWDDWLYLIKIKAASLGIWELVDPAKSTKPEHLERPLAPNFIVPTDPTKISKESFELYQMQAEVYKIRLEQYEHQQKTFGELMDYFKDTISGHNAFLIQNSEPNPWSILRALHSFLAPTDRARAFEIDTKYQRVVRGSGVRDLETWLDDFERVYVEATLYSVGDIVDRAQRDFLRAVIKYDPILGESYIIALNKGNEIPEMYSLIVKFREAARRKHAYIIT